MKIPFNSNSVRLTSPYGKRTINGATDNHKGYDLVGVGSSDVTAVIGGSVSQSRIVTDKSNLTWQWGNYVTVKGDDGNYYYYCHLASRAVKKGQRINAGDKIGVMGATGYVFGAHLHFEVRKSDGKTAISPEIVTGIPNKVGTHTNTVDNRSQLEKDIDVLVKHKIISTPEYWEQNANKMKYLPELIHNMAEAIR